MSFSLPPLFALALLAFLLWMACRARRSAAISSGQSRGAYGLVAALALWSVVLVALGLGGVHEALAAWPVAPQVLWQAVVPVAIVMLALLVPSLREALAILGDVTPWRALIAIQAFRIGAIGSVVKALRGDISSSFPLWVGIPDFVFGASALLVAVLYARGRIEHRPTFLTAWSLVGAAIILVPTFGLMPYWMHEPGFAFIFEFPMVLAPGIAVPVLVLLNLLLAWRSFVAGRSGLPADDVGLVRRA